MIIDKMRFSIAEVNSNEILTHDLHVKEPEVTINLSSPSRVMFSVDQGQQQGSAAGINWKNYGQWIIPEVRTDNFGDIMLSNQLVTDNKIDPQSGDLQIDGLGYLGYPKGIPWLENFNPIAVDPAEVIQRIYAHIQSFTNANLGIEVYPSSTGTQMLPGYSFNGSILSFDFFAMFVRAIDMVDCGDQILALARDLPLDLFEEAAWNGTKDAIQRKLKIAYPLGGLQQDYLAFRLGENIINAERAEERDIEPVSDVIIRSWLPGRVVTHQLSNADMTRARRVVMEEDANINNLERAQAWAKRKLTRRNIPKSFQKITIDPNHPNAPFGSFNVGDSIFIEARNFPWSGDIEQWHRIVSMKINDKDPFIELGVKVEGAWDYDPIIWDPDVITEPPEDPNLLSNGYFTSNMAGWYSRRGAWIRVATSGYAGDGCVRIDMDDDGERLESEKVQVTANQEFDITAAVRWQETTYSGNPPYTFAIGVTPYFQGGVAGPMVIVDSEKRDGAGPFTPMLGPYTVPATGVNEITLSLIVHENVTGGIAFWDDARILPK